jgi:hypothetical protein
MLFPNRLLTRAAPIQSHDREGVVSATNAQHRAVEDLAERFRCADPDEAKRLGDELGRMVFGG